MSIDRLGHEPVEPGQARASCAAAAPELMEAEHTTAASSAGAPLGEPLANELAESKTAITYKEFPFAQMNHTFVIDGREVPPLIREESLEESIPDELFLEDNYLKAAPHAALPAVLVDQQLLDEIYSIPDRFGFKIGDVADLLGIKQYILRYWEQEFEVLKPKKASNNQRLYTKKDVENAFLIKKLLYRDRFSIEGARQAMKDVKFALKKEKEYSIALQKNDEKNSDFHHQLLSFIGDIKKMKKLFV